MPGFRIRLQFSRKVCSKLEEDYSNGCWYYVDIRKHLSVAHLLTEIAELFSIPTSDGWKIQSFLDGLLVLPSSPADILEKDDCLKLKFVKTQSKVLVSSENGNEINLPRLLNGFGDDPMDRGVNPMEINSMGDHNYEESEDTREYNFGGEPGPKKKRRRRKNKTAVREVRTSMAQCLARIREEPENSPETLSQIKNQDPPKMSECPPKRRHIRFNDEDYEVVPEPTMQSYPVLSKTFCRNEKQRNVSTVYKLPKKQDSSSSSSEDEESKQITSSPNGILCDTVVGDNGLPSPPQIGDPWLQLSSQLKVVNKENSKQYRENGSALFPPKIGETISFKMLELTDKFTPEISGSKIAEVTSFDEETRLVTLDLINGTIGVQSEDSGEEPSSVATVSWSSLIDPKSVE